MANFYDDNKDLKFYFEKAIDWEALIRITEHDYKRDDGFRNKEEALDFYGGVLDLVGRFAAEEVAPRAAAIDEAGLTFEKGEVRSPQELTDIFEQIKGLELHGLCIPRELGGSNCPLLLYMMCNELMGRADVSVMAHHSFHGGMAMVMLMYSILEGSTEMDKEGFRITKTRFQEEIGRMIRGEAWGSMDITEPEAGSDMAALKTRGRRDDQGNWFVTGQKIFITSGHGQYHFVVARTEKPKGDEGDPFAGLKGLSLFLVPAYEEGPGGKRRPLAHVIGIEKKLGHHGSATCTISFEDTPAHLLGKRGEGFRQMLLLMNNARVGVGFESLGLCEAAYRKAAAYASERNSMGKTIDRHEMIADYLDEMDTDIKGIRALTMHGAWHEEMTQKLRIALRFLHDENDMEGKRLAKLADAYAAESRRVTPLIKYLAAEKAVQIAGRAVQILGGVGYMREYGAEKLLRDAMAMPIYEGTSQIQALMAMKDALGAIMKNPQGFLKDLAQTRWRSLSASDPLERRTARIQSLSFRARRYLVQRIAADKFRAVRKKPMNEWSRGLFKSWDPKKDFARAMLHAENLTRIMADATVCGILLEQTKRFPERRELLSRYLERAEPRCRYLYDRITGTGDRLLAQLREREKVADKAEG